MEADSVITKTEKPTDWVNSLVVVEKRDKSLRLCLDPGDLNKAIKREHFMILTPQDIVVNSGESAYSRFWINAIVTGRFHSRLKVPNTVFQHSIQ